LVILNTIERFKSMKQTYLVVGFLALCAANAAAIDLNTDAMKKMQQEGHKIIEEEEKRQQGQRAFKLPNGQCLQAAGANVVHRKCNGNAGNQKWRLDGKGQLIGHDSNCVGAAGGGKQPGANVVLQKCNGSAGQKWKLDGAKRLANQHGMCLQPNGNNVVTAVCSNAPIQKWG
jgi:hypothetical protein